ncbi:MAG: hypothetical protein ACYDD4_03540 [Acidimicrobiales bacterium]
MTPDAVDEVEGEWLAWLADAPLFVDNTQVAVFYDAVLRPRYRTVQLEFAHDQTVLPGFQPIAHIGGLTVEWRP